MPPTHTAFAPPPRPPDSATLSWPGPPLTAQPGCFPGGRRFAFTILDDPDDARLEDVRPVYDRLRQLGLRTTTTVWPLAPPPGAGGPGQEASGETLRRRAYRQFVRELLADGFEIGSHGASMVSSDRDRTLAGLRLLARQIGRPPRLHANHDRNRENLCWGSRRFQSRPVRLLLRLLRRAAEESDGDANGSPRYWGDVAQRHIDYVRNFAFKHLDLRRCDPHSPYRLRSTPGVRHWFSTCGAPDVEAFLRLVTPRAVAALEEKGGVAIVSTHFGRGFARNGRLDPRVDAVLTDVARRPGWFVPVSTVLDHLRAERGAPMLGPAALLRLELRYLWHRLRRRR